MWSGWKPKIVPQFLMKYDRSVFTVELDKLEKSVLFFIKVILAHTCNTTAAALTRASRQLLTAINSRIQTVSTSAELLRLVHERTLGRHEASLVRPFIDQFEQKKENSVSGFGAGAQIV